jgi:pimeloyl-ACP methyl ester carboxylesterase
MGTVQTLSCVYLRFNIIILCSPQFADKELTSKVNLLAIDEIGHGQTKGPEGWSYWTTAQMSLDVMDKLNIKKAFALGTSQGGFIVSRMAILAPERVQGIVSIGSSMFGETQYTRDVGCWNTDEVFANWYKWVSSTKPVPNFEPSPVRTTSVYYDCLLLNRDR